MKATFLATVAAILVAYGSATKIVCPPVNAEDVTLLPNPHDCKTYYSCNEGFPHLMHCHVGLEFNPIERVCDWPEHAGCRATKPKPPEQPGGSSRPNGTQSSKDPLPNNGLGQPDLPPRPDLPPHPDAPSRPPKPACPAEAPGAADSPRPSKPPRPTELPPLTEPRPTPSSRPIELPRPTLPPKPATTTRRRPIWPIWPIWPLPSIGHAASHDNINFVDNDVDGVDALA